MQTNSWLVSYGFKDSEGNTSETRVAFPISNYSYEQVEAKAKQVETAIRQISDAAITHFRILRNYEPPFIIPPSNGSDVTRTGVFVVTLGDNNNAFVLVPSIRFDVLHIGADSVPSYTVNLEDVRVQALMSALQDATDEYDVPIVAIAVGGISQ